MKKEEYIKPEVEVIELLLEVAALGETTSGPEEGGGTDEPFE